MSMQDVATNCAANLIELIEAGCPDLAGKVWHVYSDDELMTKHKGLIFPCMGVIYDGTRNRAAGDVPNGGGGLSADVSFTLILFFRLSPIATSDPKDQAITLIDAVRRAIFKQRSPTGHFWKFQMEVSVPGGKTSVAYVQRWHTAVQLN